LAVDPLEWCHILQNFPTNIFILKGKVGFKTPITTRPMIKLKTYKTCFVFYRTTKSYYNYDKTYDKT